MAPRGRPPANRPPMRQERLSADAERAADALLALGVKNVVVTLGPSGVYYEGEEGAGRVPAPSVENVIDTTAAGDCFTGALAVRLAEGAALADAVKFAVTAASISVTRQGAQSSLPKRKAVEAILPTPPTSPTLVAVAAPPKTRKKGRPRKDAPVAPPQDGKPPRKRKPRP